MSNATTQDSVEALVDSFHPEPGEFIPGESEIWPTGAVISREDRVALVTAALNAQIAHGQNAARLERGLSRRVGVRKTCLTNSGSSANLLALSSLTSKDRGAKRLTPGDEVITVAAGFPTTVNPILQNGLVPVYVDIDIPTYNARVEDIESAIGPKTRAIMLAHTAGNPYAVREVKELADRHGLFLVEDNCDALGSLYEGQPTGSFGTLSTLSCYPAHHITMGEGGAVFTNDVRIARTVESLRDWGRDCWCPPGESDTCHKRFQFTLGDLPEGFDHKYIYSNIGYNLKATDIQAALGYSQLSRFDTFAEARRRNWRLLREGLDGTPGLILPEPTPGSDPCWYGFVITVAEDSPFSAAALIDHIEDANIRTRRLFGGNLLRHPAYTDTPRRIAMPLENTDRVMNNTFHIGVYPGITEEMVAYMVDTIRTFPAISRKAA